MSNEIARRDDSVQVPLGILDDMDGATRRARRCKTQSSFSYQTRRNKAGLFLFTLIVYTSA